MHPSIKNENKITASSHIKPFDIYTFINILLFKNYVVEFNIFYK